VLEAPEAGWRSGTELGDFVDHPASAEERDWRSLDPRRIGEDDADDGGDTGSAANDDDRDA
jgi:hypothetical protein